MNAFAGLIAAGDQIFRLRQQRDVFRDHAGFKTGIGVGGAALGGVGQFEVRLRAAGVGGRVGERRVTHAGAAAVPVRGIAHPHQYVVERDDRGEFRLRQHRREVLGDERDLGIGFGRVSCGIRIVGRRRRRGADIAQHALGVEWRDLGAEIAGRHRQVAGDANERTNPHDVAVADAGDGGDPDDVARGRRFARRRQPVALAQAGGLVVGAEGAAQRALDPFRHLGEGHFTVEGSKNGAADESRAAQSGQDGAAKPLYGDAAAVDDSGFGPVDGKRRLVTKIDDPGLASVAAPA